MKKVIYLSAVLATSVWFSCNTINTPGKAGSHQTVAAPNACSATSDETKTVEIGVISGIHVETAIKVIIRKSSENKAVITSNVMKYVSVKNNNGKLKISYQNTPQNGLRNAVTEVTVYTSDFSRLEAESAAGVVLENGFNFKNLSLELTSASQLEGHIRADELKAEITSASKLNATLDVKKLNLEASSASKATLSGKAQTVKVEANSAAKVDVQNLKYDNIDVDNNSLGKVISMNSNVLKIHMI